MDKTFQNQVALVTGGSFGIGRATCVAFAKRGAKVVIADWIADKDGTTQQLIKDVGGESIFVQCDVSKSGDVKALIDKTINTFGRLDYAFIKQELKAKQDIPMSVQRKTGIKRLA